ncbi:glucose 1-dehydrogenase [Brachybacterium halotolerans subsp. kimchii]|uniref:SDR family NAD(P)-dependent oxidoreductase n=1 Tax=Brachybacterium halotolerans TaxID=2795215 RepID=UPI001E2CF7AF|nr:glucose 1-dehydrogenase [Brachybacterium halotolerans]UEJ83323.1 glucose 1-dehydrogenase [Brachybacterium halotolerans subsp. kimchii]
MGQLAGRTALITGGSTGIGLATAQRFIAEGARVYLTGRRREALAAAAGELGDRAITVRNDVSDLDDLDALFARIAADGNRLDVLFANAGGGEANQPLHSLQPDAFDRTFGVNVRGTVFTVQRALPLLNEGASIVLTGSSSARRGTAGFGVYSATKAAIRQFGRVWAAELAPRGVRVNTVVPGTTDTPGLRGLAEDSDRADAFVGELANGTALRRAADPAEIADAVLFLASDQSSFITGSELFVDGGEVQVYP